MICRKVLSLGNQTRICIQIQLVLGRKINEWMIRRHVERPSLLKDNSAALSLIKLLYGSYMTLLLFSY
jgi:hypothetical protein